MYTFGVVPSENISLMNLTAADKAELKVIDHSGSAARTADNNANRIDVGDICVDDMGSVDGEAMPKRYFKIRAIVGKIRDIVVNSYIVKEVIKDGNGQWVEHVDNNKRMFSLTRGDCRFLGITYEDNLEIIPIPAISNSFYKLNENEEANPQIEEEAIHHDFDNYPVNEKDNTIHYITIAIRGFLPCNKDGVIVSDGSVVPIKDFIQNLQVIIKHTIPSYAPGTLGIERGREIPYKLVAQDKRDLDFNIIGGDGNIYLELQTWTFTDANQQETIGISPNALEGFNINDLIEVRSILGVTHPHRNQSHNSARRDTEILALLSDENWMRHHMRFE